MHTFPIHALSRRYLLGTPDQPIVESGVAGLRLGNGVLRLRPTLGQPIRAIDLRLLLTTADKAILDAFYTSYRASEFLWADPVTYLTYECVYDPESPPQIQPHSRGDGLFHGSIRLLPVVPTVSVPMLEAHYKLNDSAADTVVADATGNGHTGTCSHNTDTMDVAGKISTALEFATASSRYVSVADDADLELLDGGSICLWCKWDGTNDSSGGAIPRLISKYGSYYLRLGTSGALNFYPVSTAAPATTAAGALISGQWRHIAVVFSSERKQIYIDGVDATLSAGDTTMPPGSATALVLGAQKADAGFFGGALDDVRIYQRPLVAAEVAAIYNAGTGTESTIVA